VQKRSLNGLISSLKELCERYKVLGLKLLILYGSYARGDYTNESDIDILVVADKLPTDPRQAYEKLIVIDRPEISPIGFNTMVFLEKLSRGDPFILEAIEDGIIICGEKIS